MKNILFSGLLLLGLAYFACAQVESNPHIVEKSTWPSGSTIASRFAPPPDFERQAAPINSFAHFLRNLPLYPESRKVKLFNGKLKDNQSAQAAVIKMDVGTRDLQQCADAVMRLRAEYLWKQKEFDKIKFNFTNGFPADYETWRNGKRIKVNGNKVSWINGSEPDTSYSAFRKYLIQVFNYAGTQSLSQELKPRNFEDLQIGDIFIQGGFPGHAIIVVDKAINPDTEDFAFLLAQSYMPAQDIHVLKNNKGKSAWYFSNELNANLHTPEWTFELTDLMHF